MILILREGRILVKKLHVSEDRCYPDYKTMFAREAEREDGIQAVSVATPNGTHYEITKAALEAGLHVICEKPLVLQQNRQKSWKSWQSGEIKWWVSPMDMPDIR